jgi:hypothetical protein
MLDVLKQFHRQLIHLPRRRTQRPDRERLPRGSKASSSRC